MSIIEDASYYQTRVLQGLFSAGNTEQEKSTRVREFTSKLHEAHFSGKNLALFQITCRYFFLTYALVSNHDFMDSIRAGDDATEAKVYEYEQFLATLRYGDAVLTTPASQLDPKATYLSAAEFSYAINRLREQTQIDMYGVALADSMKILISGKTVENKFLQGFDAAHQYYAQQLVDIEHVGGQELPAGTVQNEGEEIRREYANAKNHETHAFSVLTGIREIDDPTGGGMPGEMWFISGFTGEGKTTECINVAYNAMMNGQNVFFGTAETLREQVRRRLICRHSINPRFNSPHGIAGDALKKGDLGVEEEKLFYEVVEDLVSNEAYGRFKIAQIPKRCTVDYYSALLAKYETEFHIHMAIWDELRLAGVGYRRGSRREELNDIITDAKQMAVSHRHMDDTVGILLLAPYQVSREKWQEAVNRGFYTKDCMAETSEAEKSADLIWSHLQMPDTHEMRCQILKYRDGSDRADPFVVEWKPEVCYIASMQSAANLDLLD